MLEAANMKQLHLPLMTFHFPLAASLLKVNAVYVTTAGQAGPDFRRGV